jgi:CBS domain containing-hemolysin-like protein
LNNNYSLILNHLIAYFSKFCAGGVSYLYKYIGRIYFIRAKKIPITGDSLLWKRYKFEIVDMDNNGIDTVLMMYANIEDSN